MRRVQVNFREFYFEKLFGKSGGGAGQGSESSQEGSKEPRSVASCRQISPVERPSAIFQTVSRNPYSISYAERPADHCSALVFSSESTIKMLEERDERCQDRGR